MAPREQARVGSRERKRRGPKVVVTNAGLRQVTIDLARRRRERLAQSRRGISKDA